MSDLEKERPRTCDAEHACLSGYLCVDGVCKPQGAVECTSGATRACGQAGGECREGTQRCSESGTFGPCVGDVGPVAEVCDGKDNDCDGTTDEDVVSPSCGVDAGVCAGKTKACVGGALELTCGAPSFGTSWEATESRCDGLDNDCDGLVDESLPPQPCDKPLGVCAAARRTCSGGALPVCATAVYVALDAGYEPLETRCDSLDNDCDGLTDSWAPALVTDGGTLVRRNVTAVVRADGGTAARRDVLAMYEESRFVVSVVRFADGTQSSPRYPAASVTAVAKASMPVLATDGVDVAQAWFEDLMGPPAAHRLEVALAGPLGEAIVNGSPGAAPTPLPGPGQGLALGLTSARIVVAWAQQDSETASTSTVVVASCPKQFTAGCISQTLGPGRNPALWISADTALVVYENAGGLSLAKLSAPAANLLTVVSNLPFGGSSEHDPVLVGTLAALDIYSVVPGTPETLWRRRGDCSGTCDATTFTSTPSLFTFAGSASSLAVAAPLLAWEDGPSTQRVARVMSLTNLQPLDVSLAGEVGRRPVPLLTGTAGFEVLFDTDDEVFARRFCGP